jgi:hypothetical protein
LHSGIGHGAVLDAHRATHGAPSARSVQGNAVRARPGRIAQGQCGDPMTSILLTDPLYIVIDRALHRGVQPKGLGQALDHEPDRSTQDNAPVRGRQDCQTLHHCRYPEYP